MVRKFFRSGSTYRSGNYRAENIGSSCQSSSDFPYLVTQFYPERNPGLFVARTFDTASPWGFTYWLGGNLSGGFGTVASSPGYYWVKVTKRIKYSATQNGQDVCLTREDAEEHADFPVNTPFWVCSVNQSPKVSEQQLITAPINAPLQYTVQMDSPLTRIPESVTATGLPQGLSLEFSTTPSAAPQQSNFIEPSGYLPTISGTPTEVGQFIVVLTASNLVGATTTALTINIFASSPSISQPSVSAITVSSATLGATITDSGGLPITSRGTVWGTNPYPTGNALAEGGNAIGFFSHNRTGFQGNTRYYFRGYVTNGVDTIYTSDETFTTLPNPPIIGPAFGITGTGFTASWSPPENTGGSYYYILEVSKFQTTFASPLVSPPIPSSSLSYDIPNLSPGTYYFRIKTVGDSGDSVWSSSSAGVTLSAKSDVITVSRESELNFFADFGSPSAQAEFTITGSGLTSDVTVSLPAGSSYELNTDGGTVYYQSRTILQQNGSVSRSVFVRLKSGSPPDTNCNSELFIYSDGAGKKITLGGIIAEPTSTQLNYFTPDSTFLPPGVRLLPTISGTENILPFISGQPAQITQFNVPHRFPFELILRDPSGAPLSNLRLNNGVLPSWLEIDTAAGRIFTPAGRTAMDTIPAGGCLSASCGYTENTTFAFNAQSGTTNYTFFVFIGIGRLFAHVVYLSNYRRHTGSPVTWPHKAYVYIDGSWQVRGIVDNNSELPFFNPVTRAYHRPVPGLSYSTGTGNWNDPHSSRFTFFGTQSPVVSPSPTELGEYFIWQTPGGFYTHNYLSQSAFSATQQAVGFLNTDKSLGGIGSYKFIVSNDAVISPNQSFNLYKGFYFSRVLSLEDPNTVKKSWSHSGLPPGIHMNLTTGEIYGSPTNAGTYTAQISVRGDDYYNPDTKTVTFNVSSDPPPPTVTPTLTEFLDTIDGGQLFTAVFPLYVNVASGGLKTLTMSNVDDAFFISVNGGGFVDWTGSSPFRVNLRAGVNRIVIVYGQMAWSGASLNFSIQDVSSWFYSDELIDNGVGQLIRNCIPARSNTQGLITGVKGIFYYRGNTSGTGRPALQTPINPFPVQPPGFGPKTSIEIEELEVPLPFSDARIQPSQKFNFYTDLRANDFPPPAGTIQWPRVKTTLSLRFSTTAGTPSSSRAFAVSGSYLTGSTVVVAAQNSSVQVSLNNSSWSQSVTLPVSNGSASATVYARLSSAATPGSVATNISISSTGATTQFLPVTGQVLNAIARPVTFSVNMNRLIALGQFFPNSETVQVHGQFNDWQGDLLADDNQDGIYTGTFTIFGAAGTSQEFKFFIPTRDPFWESIEGNRSFVLGAANIAQILDTVWFNNEATIPRIFTQQASVSSFYVGGALVSRIHLGEDQLFP